jgi:hypothetical protein
MASGYRADALVEEVRGPVAGSSVTWLSKAFERLSKKGCPLARLLEDFQKL